MNRIVKKIKKSIRNIQKEYYHITNKPQRILFDHIPKCAGTTITSFLLNNFPSRFIYLHGSNPSESVEEFRALTEKKRFKYRLITGHLAHLLLNDIAPNTLNVTVLREPIDRIISHYYYVKRKEVHYLHNEVINRDIQLEDFCTSGLSNELTNWYVSHYSGLSLTDITNNPLQSVELALKNITEKYSIIGFQDEIPAFMSEIKNIAKLPLRYHNEIVNKTRNRINIDESSLIAREKISQANNLDILLYNKLLDLRENGVIVTNNLINRNI